MAKCGLISKGASRVAHDKISPCQTKPPRLYPKPSVPRKRRCCGCPLRHQGRQRDGLDIRCQRVTMQARVDNIKRIKFEVFHRDAHAWRHFGCIAAFEFHANALLVFEHQQIKLCTLVGGPKIRLIGLRYSQHLFQSKTFPTGAAQGVGKYLWKAANAHHGMKQARVAKIDFGCLDLSFG